MPLSNEFGVFCDDIFGENPFFAILGVPAIKFIAESFWVGWFCDTADMIHLNRFAFFAVLGVERNGEWLDSKVFTLFALGALRSLRAFAAGWALRALRALRSLRAFAALRALRALRSLGTLRALRALRAWLTLDGLQPLFIGERLVTFGFGVCDVSCVDFLDVWIAARGWGVVAAAAS